jgi:hypothetical protein
MKTLPPVLHGRDWEWPSDGGFDAWPDFLGRIPVRRLLRQAETLDAPLDLLAQHRFFSRKG